MECEVCHLADYSVNDSDDDASVQLLQAIDIVDQKTLKASNTLILGHVKYIHMRKDTMDPVRGVPDPGKLKAVVRLGGITYAKLGDGYQIPRPAWANVKDELKETFGEDAVNGKGSQTRL